jgi:endonuclease/exonuclease/phosphatase (EEP) superfamily protein YafD
MPPEPPAAFHASATAAPSAFGRPWRRGRWLDAFAAAVLVGSGAGWFGRWHWLLDLTTHFRWYWLLAALGGLAACLRWPRPTAVACLAVAAVINARDLMPAWLPPAAVHAPAAAAEADQRVFVISMNVHRVNDDPTAAVAYLRDRRPDIVAVLEVDDDWAAALEGLAEQFPHRLIRPRPDNFGIAVLSRWPLVDPQVVAFSETGFPSIIATVRRESGDFRFIATHPYPPFNGRATEALLVHLAGVAEAVESSPLPCIVAGDLNATPWSRPFRELLARSGLVDTAVGHGVQPTWHAHLPAPRIPIDHVLVPPAAVVLRREVGPDIGSDHFPVEAELILPAAPASPRPRER